MPAHPLQQFNMLSPTYLTAFGIEADAKASATRKHTPTGGFEIEFRPPQPLRPVRFLKMVVAVTTMQLKVTTMQLKVTTMQPKVITMQLKGTTMELRVTTMQLKVTTMQLKVTTSHADPVQKRELLVTPLTLA